MKRYNGLYIFLLCFALFTVSFSIGYYITDLKHRNNIDISEQNVENNENEFEDLTILQEEDRITPNTYIEMRIHYKECHHNIIKESEKNDNIVNMTEDEYREYLKENYPNVKLVKFSPEEIILEETRDHVCPNH